VDAAAVVALGKLGLNPAGPGVEQRKDDKRMKRSTRASFELREYALAGDQVLDPLRPVLSGLGPGEGGLLS
jgi:hypothetical protein